MTICKTCNDTKRVNRKVWENMPNYKGVHPSVLAGVPAQRTIIQVPCPDCVKGKSPEP